MMSIYDVSSVTHPIPEYKTSKQSKIKALKSKLKQVISKTKSYGLASL